MVRELKIRYCDTDLIGPGGFLQTVASGSSNIFFPPVGAVEVTDYGDLNGGGAMPMGGYETRVRRGHTRQVEGLPQGWFVRHRPRQ